MLEGFAILIAGFLAGGYLATALAVSLGMTIAPGNWVIYIIGGIVGVVVLLGAGKMQKLESYQFALTASIMAMVPCISPCCLFGLPLGIWALVVLNKPEVKSHFG